MTAYDMVPQEAYLANHLMAHAFREWCDAGEQTNYVDLARRLNAACITAVKTWRESKGRDSA